MEDVSILGPFCPLYGQMVYIFYGPLIHLVVIWDIFPLFGMLYREKSGNPARDVEDCETVFSKINIFATKKEDVCSVRFPPFPLFLSACLATINLARCHLLLKPS
jgi:hypothetical protein